VDDQSFSLQKFFGMLAVGDTVATEILFAPRSAMLYADADWADIQVIGKSRLLIGSAGASLVTAAAKLPNTASRAAAWQPIARNIKEL
jgi:hypothetical protein